MKIVIDIPEKVFDEIYNKNYYSLKGKEALRLAVRDSTPLPKGHGRLIECEPIYDRLIRSYRTDKKDYPERGKDYRIGLSQAMDLLNVAPTIIEADGGGE